MRKRSLSNRIGVCSWSLHAERPEELVEKLAALDIRRVQLALDPIRHTPQVWGRVAEVFRAGGITIVSGMFGCVGEDYSTLEAIRLTGGIAPDATWEQNWTNARVTAALAKELGVKLVTFHAGFLPHADTDPAFEKMLLRLGEVADVFKAAGVAVGLETGQETADALLQVLRRAARKNLGVNFDPANMILYDKGDPIEAVRVLGPWIRQVHIKDAVRTRVPGTWGQETATGAGEVDWPAFFVTLKEQGFKGHYVIEREAGHNRLGDIRAARAVVERNAV